MHQPRHVIDWANESFGISVSPDVGYCIGSGAGHWYDAENERLESGEPAKTVVERLMA